MPDSSDWFDLLILALPRSFSGTWARDAKRDVAVIPGETPSQRVARELRTRLQADEWATGDRLPSVTDIAAQYQVGRATVIRALKTLSDAGLIVTTRGWGTFRAGADQSQGPE